MSQHVFHSPECQATDTSFKRLETVLRACVTGQEIENTKKQHLDRSLRPLKKELDEFFTIFTANAPPTPPPLPPTKGAKEPIQVHQVHSSPTLSPLPPPAPFYEVPSPNRSSVEDLPLCELPEKISGFLPTQLVAVFGYLAGSCDPPVGHRTCLENPSSLARAYSSFFRFLSKNKSRMKGRISHQPKEVSRHDLELLKKIRGYIAQLDECHD
mmetsp:Transcript_36953/g.50934  ORF Transcript_36953/g.50934 Transcript_36953/m.50934 type:complete len:212 (-) Transcript_36953:286-921(-)